jgi:hypothetical protein
MGTHAALLPEGMGVWRGSEETERGAEQGEAGATQMRVFFAGEVDSRGLIAAHEAAR